MTRKEAKIILQCRGNGYTEDEFNEALEIAYSALDSFHLSNLDEAEFKYAQSLDEIPANQEEEKMIYDAFKAGAEWCDAQIPKLSNDTDKTAEKMYPMTTTPPTPIEVAAYHNAAQQKLRDAFKAGVKWSREQMIKITKDDNLDEAAEKYAIQGHENHTNVNYINTYIEGKRIGFIAGAEWMAGQGYTKEGIARPDDCEIWVNLTDTDIKDGDKVIVQVRKK